VKKDIVSGIFTSLALRVIQGAALLILHLVLTNALDLKIYGTFVLVSAILTILSLLGGLGFNFSARRIVARYKLRNSEDLGRYITFAFVSTLLFSSLLGLSFALTLVISSGFDVTLLALLIFFILPLSTMVDLVEGINLGLKKIARAQLAQAIVVPASFLITLHVGWITYPNLKLDVNYLFFARLVALGFTLFIFGNVLVSHKNSVRRVTKNAQSRLWTKLSLGILLYSGAYQILCQTDAIMIGLFYDSEMVALYNPASRVSHTIVFVVGAVGAILSPRLGEIAVKRHQDKAQSLLNFSWYFLFGLGGGICLFLICYSTQILGLFGDVYSAASSVLVILVLAQFISIVIGPASIVLNMTGFQHVSSIILCFVIASNLLLNIVLLPAYGIHGAALASGISLIVGALVMAIFVKKKTKLIVNPIFCIISTSYTKEKA